MTKERVTLRLTTFSWVNGIPYMIPSATLGVLLSSAVLVILSVATDPNKSTDTRDAYWACCEAC